LENIPTILPDDLKLPTGLFMITSDLAVFDHLQSKVTIICNAINWDASDARIDEAYADACQRIVDIEGELRKMSQLEVLPEVEISNPDFSRTMSDNKFLEKVEVLKEEIRSGEAFQIVLSQRFEMKRTAPTLDIYRALRISNPSPYMYYICIDKDFVIVGSSPEALIKIENREAMVHPIAGTRPRSVDPEKDKALGEELLADPKERAEHLMLVDLGRNDLGRVCENGSVSVVDFMSVERYSHVMHIVSTVVGKVRGDKLPFDALLSVFPAGTLSGAPKPRAMQIIEENEVQRRGVYGGAIGYIDFAGNIDTCIAIRTAIILGDRVFIQAGAGIVADSDPSSENQETINKAAAVMSAVTRANKWNEIRGSL
jgi:anthranilate synthase component 1